jgi:BirA family biotin operon repressor/biotin-[acetyl-CoA-carboxylase] ligase
MKAQILDKLRQATEAISGPRLSAELGVSRVTVWKHIQALKGHGYDIQASGRGYRLVNAPDALFGWEFPGRQDRVHHYPEVDSTMDIARKMARGGCPPFTVVVTDRQRRGRGRLSRRWFSDAGGLYFTVVLRPEIPPTLSPRVNLLVAVVLAGTLRRLYGVAAAVKWPNDVLVGDRKVAGILSEMEAEADRVTFIDVGIGVNVNNDPPPVESGAVSLQQLTGGSVARRALLAGFLDDFEARLHSAAFDGVIAEWKAHALTLNRRVKIVTLNDSVEGTAVDVDENGSLIVRLDDGALRTVLYGDCFHQ